MESTTPVDLPTRRYRPLTVLAKATTAAFTMYAAALAFLGVTIHQILGHARAAPDERDYDAIRSLASRLESFETLLYMVLGGCILTFCLWTYRAVANASLMRDEPITSPGWAVGYYFIPIVNFWKPLVAIREAWRHSEPLQTTDGEISTSRGAVPALITLWWISFMGSRLVSRIADKMQGNPDDYDSYTDALAAGRFAIGAELVAVALALTVVWKLTRRIERRIASELPAAQVRGSR